MNQQFIDDLTARAKAAHKRIAFPEADCADILRCAEQLLAGVIQGTRTLAAVLRRQRSPVRLAGDRFAFIRLTIKLASDGAIHRTRIVRAVEEL
jgi:hypothetical protein